MLAIERQTKILQLLNKKGTVRISELKDMFGVSEMTIRRDFKKLEKQGYLIRTHGGASLHPQGNIDVTFNIRNQKNVPEKEAIAKKAVEMVNNGDTIILDAGTTTTAMARFLENKKDVIVLTNSITVAQELVNKPGITLVMTGGNLRHNTLSLVGSLAEENIQRFNVNKAFIGTSGLSLDHGLTNANIYESEVKKAMINSAKKSIVLADSSKFNNVSFNSFSTLSTVDMIITDKKAPMDIVQKIRKTGIEVIMVE
ncbi:MAG: DeoR/GlpR transcriptional regulator [Desulfotomaculum sp.]|nr:DeoR/GlpR transcriptional regulator [Desulfotomaculum sp.]